MGIGTYVFGTSENAGISLNYNCTSLIQSLYQINYHGP